MITNNPQDLGRLAKLVLILAVLLLAAGTLWHGVTLAVLHWIWNNLINRPSEPMAFRFMVQPVMALIAAIHDGVKDARSGRSLYFWTVLHDPRKRVARLREGLNATARIILLAVGMDVIYQISVLNTFYPTEALLIALQLAFLPYVFICGPVARIARWRTRASPAEQIRG
jgi:hypothetical protein